MCFSGLLKSNAMRCKLSKMSFSPPPADRYLCAPWVVDFRKCMDMLMIKELIIFQWFPCKYQEGDQPVNKDDYIATLNFHVEKLLHIIRFIRYNIYIYDNKYEMLGSAIHYWLGKCFRTCCRSFSVRMRRSCAGWPIGWANHLLPLGWVVYRVKELRKNLILFFIPA